MNNAGPGPNSAFYYDTCYNAYAFPDNDGASKFTSSLVSVWLMHALSSFPDNYTPADLVDYTCPNTDITLTLCPGTTSDYR